MIFLQLSKAQTTETQYKFRKKRNFSKIKNKFNLKVLFPDG